MAALQTAGSSIVVHHSRNTAEKQWDETRVIVFQGVARTFQRQFVTFLEIEDAKRAWLLLLEQFDDYALQFGQEVTTATMHRYHAQSRAAWTAQVSPRR